MGHSLVELKQTIIVYNFMHKHAKTPEANNEM